MTNIISKRIKVNDFVKNKKREDEEEKYERQSDFSSSSSSNVDSLINIKKPKDKTQQEIIAENEALEGFVLECEKHHIVTTQILKNIVNKKFRFQN